MASDEKFYLGKIFDLKKGALLDQKLLYDPPDLTTHAIVTGMTGSGKTGLCIGLIEEAALKGIPAILVDPKGDLTNLLLTFPDFLASSYEPWIDPASARRENKTIAQSAETVAQSWKKGLSDWGLTGDDLKKLKGSVERAIYTPGSSTGLPISIMASFDTPELDWENNEEVLREKIASTVTALLTLVGLKDIDPLRSREHILLSNIIEFNWKNGNQLDLTNLILQTQDPPFEKLGAFPLNNFFPSKDRAELAMLLNNFLASPSFQNWIDGESLDIQSLLYTSEGKPKHSIFYLAHLSDAERMFFVTLLYSAVETWMRKQRGTSDLRALVYFDEIHGYLPPIANPPSKPLIVRLLKTARAFGVGLVLTTQNPVDVDYKALSNAGTWMIGRLQTDQDKQRLLDGLESAAGGIQRSDFDKMISALGKRVFLYHNVHEKQPYIFQTRWAMNYLAGPLTLTQVPELNRLAGAYPANSADSMQRQKKDTATAKTSSPSSEKPVFTSSKEYYIYQTSGSGSPSLRPSLLAVAEVRYFKQNPPVDFKHTVCAIVDHPRETGQDWDSYSSNDFNISTIQNSAKTGSKYYPTPDFMKNSEWWSGQEREFEQWVFETDIVSLKNCSKLGLSAGPETSDESFKLKCQQAAKEKANQEIKKIESAFNLKKKSIENKIETQDLQVKKYKQQLTTRGVDTALKIGGSLLKLATKGKLTGLSTSMSKGRMAIDAGSRVKEAETKLENLQEELNILQQNYENERQSVYDKWDSEVGNISELRLSPTKQNIRITHFGIGWRE